MKPVKFILFAFFLITFISTASARDFYQIKVYNIKDKTQEAMLDSYLKDAYLPALHRAGIKKVGVFKPIEDDAAFGTKVFVLIPANELEKLFSLDDILLKDSKYISEGKEYIEAAYNNPPYERMESIILRAFTEMTEFGIPNHKTPKNQQIYELRSYEGPTELMYRKKVEMFNAGGEVKLFHELNFQEVFYGEVLSGSKMPNLMYMTTFSDMKTHDEQWDRFRNHPVWKELSAMEKYKNTVSHSDKWLCHPTDYSEL